VDIRSNIAVAVAGISALVAFWLAWRFWTATPVEQPPTTAANLTPEQIRKKLRTGATILVVYGLLSLAWAGWILWRGGI
jgi:hypothetical protein